MRFTRLGFRRALACVFHRSTGFEVDMAGPADVVDEGERILQLAVLAIDDVEETVAVSVGGRLDRFAVLALVVEQNQLVVAGEVPGIVWRVLVVPLDLAGGQIQRDDGVTLYRVILPAPADEAGAYALRDRVAEYGFVDARVVRTF